MLGFAVFVIWVLVSNFWQFCLCLWLSLFDIILLSCKLNKLDRTRPPKSINRPARSDHLNGWSTGWSFANPTQSGKIENYPQTQPAWPVPTPNYQPTTMLQYIFKKKKKKKASDTHTFFPFRYFSPPPSLFPLLLVFMNFSLSPSLFSSSKFQFNLTITKSLSNSLLSLTFSFSLSLSLYYHHSPPPPPPPPPTSNAVADHVTHTLSISFTFFSLSLIWLLVLSF